MATRVSELIARLEDQFSQKAEQIAHSSRAMGDSVDSASKSLDAQNNSLQETARTTVQLSQSMDGVQKAINRTETAYARMEERLESARSALAKGAIDQQKYNDIVATQTAIYEKVEAASSKTVNALRERSKALSDGSKATTDANKVIQDTTDKAGLSSQKMGILADEAHKFFDQVMAGGSAFQAAFYQLPNMIQIMGGFGGALETVAGWMVGPAGLAVAGAAAAASVYKIGSAAEAEQEQLATLSQHLRATRDDYTAMAGAADRAARQLSTSSGLSLNDSRSVTTTFAAVPTVDSSSLTSLTQEARDLAEVMGETVPEAAKEMASAYADPAKAAQDFADKGLLGVHQGLVTQVKDLQDSGNRMQAWQLLMGQLESATRGAVDQGLTPFQQSVRNLKDAWAGPMEGVENFGNKVGDFLVAQTAKTIDGLTNLINKVKELKGWMDSFQPEHTAYVAQQQQIQQGTSSGMSGLIDTVGQQIGANSDVISLAHRIQPVESATGQYDRNGAVVTSSAGAIGGMQIMPANAAGNDLTDPTGNVTAAERLLVRLYSKYSGNEQLVAMAYNWGEGNVDKYLQGKTTVPQSVQDYAQKVTGGQMYGATTLATMQGKVDDALKTSDGSTASQVTDQTNAIKQLTSAQEALDTLHKAGAVSDSDYAARTQDLTQRLMAHKGALNDLRDPMQELAHQQQQATDAAWAGTAAQKAMVQIDQQTEEAARKMGYAHATAAQLLKAESNEQQVLTGQFNSSIDSINRKTDAQDALLSSYDSSKGSLDDYLRSVEAYESVQDTSLPKDKEQTRQIQEKTDAMRRAAEVQGDLSTAGKLYGQSLDLSYIKAETDAIGQNSDAVSVQMAVLKERNALLENGRDLTSKASQTDLDNVAAIQTATNAYQKQQDTLNELTSDISSAADTLSSSFTQALVNASNGGVTFKSAMQGVESQLISVIAKLALINPLLNAIDGKSRTTLGDVSSILSGSSSSSVSSGAAAISTDTGGWGWNPLTATGGSGSSASWLSSGLKTNLFGTATVGNLLGGISGGFGIGSALSGIGGGTKTNGLIGSGVGAAAGAAAGSFIPVVGTMLGGLIGGGLGGLLGGLFGHKKNPYTIDQVMTTGGSLSLGKTWDQAQTDQITEQLKSDIASFNKVLSSAGVTIGGGDGGLLGTVRDDKNNKDKSLQSVSLTDLLKQATYSTSDATFQQALQQGLPSDATSVSDYATAIANLKTMADTVDQLGVAVSKFNSDGTVTVGSFTKATGDLKTALDTALDGKSLSTSDLQTQISTITTFVDTTMPGLLKATVSGQQSWVDQMAALKQTYEAAASQANQYGLDGTQLNATYQSLYDQGFASQLDTLRQSDLSVQARYQTATGDDEAAALTNFDVSADQQRQQLADNWKNFLGDAYTSQQEYINQSADLEKTLSAERLKIQQQYNDQALQSAESVMSSLETYGAGLATSDASPLSAADQYKVANDNFTTDLTAAQGGSFTALQAMQGDMQTLLAQSKTFNGSGTAYAQDYARVMQALQSLGSIGTDDLTASAMKELMKSSTDTLNTTLAQLVDLATKQLNEDRMRNMKSTTGKAA